MTPPRSMSKTQLLAAGLIAVVASVHFQQYVDFISEVPTVGVLFLFNAAGGRRPNVRAAEPGPCSAPARVNRFDRPRRSITRLNRDRSEQKPLGYQEPTLRLPIVIALLAEATAIPLLIKLMIDHRKIT